MLNMLDANTQWVLLGSLLLGMASGVLGSFALLRKQSLIGDAMAHAALPGICLAFLLYGTKTIGILLLGAALSGLIATYFIQSIIQHSRIKEDTAIGLVLSVFFGFGIVLLTYISQTQTGNQSGLDDYIFGQAASLVGNDVKLISIVATLLLAITYILFKELKLLTFDPQFARGIGLPTGILNGLLMTLIVGAVVIGLQAVGVILMAAMLITPAIAARYWTERLDRMVIIAGVIGALSGIIGTLISTLINGMPTGPVIIVAATLMFLFSMIFAPQRGLLAKMVKQMKIRKLVLRENVLQSLYDLYELSEGKKDSFPIDEICKKRAVDRQKAVRLLDVLKKEGLVKQTAEVDWMLTPSGIETAYEITLEQRLKEMFLMHERQFSHYNLRDFNQWRIKHLPEDLLTELTNLLILHKREPRFSANHSGEITADVRGLTQRRIQS